MGIRMRGDPLSPNDHVSRYCSGGRLTSTGKPSGAAFTFNTNPPEEFLSVNWLEYFAGLTPDQQLAEIRKALEATGLTLRRTGRFALYTVQTIIDNFPSAGTAVTVLHWPEPDDPSHSGIFNVNDADKDILQEMLAFVECQMMPGIIENP